MPNFEVSEDEIIENYKKSTYGQLIDKENNLSWEFSSLSYVYKNTNDKEMSYDFEPHIFWQDVYNDIKNGNFKSEKLIFRVWVNKLDEDNIPSESVYSNTIKLMEDDNFKKLRDFLVIKEVIEEYSKPKIKLEPIPDTSHLKSGEADKQSKVNKNK